MFETKEWKEYQSEQVKVWRSQSKSRWQRWSWQQSRRRSRWTRSWKRKRRSRWWSSFSSNGIERFYADSADEERINNLNHQRNEALLVSQVWLLEYRAYDIGTPHKRSYDISSNNRYYYKYFLNETDQLGNQFVATRFSTVRVAWIDGLALVF